jgi:hypothetical protein
MNEGCLGDFIGEPLTEAEDEAVRSVRAYQRHHRGSNLVQACAGVGVSLGLLYNARSKMGLEVQLTYDPTDIASDKEAFSFSCVKPRKKI